MWGIEAALDEVLRKKGALVEVLQKKIETIKTRSEQEFAAAFQEFASEEKKITDIEIFYSTFHLEATLLNIKTTFDKVNIEFNLVNGKYLQ